MNKSIRIVKKEYTYWDTFNDNCITDISYKLQYQKSFIGIKYWKDFKEMLCGMCDCYTSTIWMSDKDLLINRFNCTMNEVKYTYE